MQIKQIKETCLYIKDLDLAESFYREKLGLSLISKVAGRHVFFRAGSSVLLCFNPDATRNEKVLPPHYASGPQHIAFEVSLENYENFKSEVIKKGIKITHLQDWKKGTRESFYFEDPEGNVLEVVPEGLWGS